MPPFSSVDQIARDLRAARTARHMSIPLLASVIGISPSQLRHIEAGRTANMRLDTLELILTWAGSRGFKTFGGFGIQMKQRSRGAG